MTPRSEIPLSHPLPWRIFLFMQMIIVPGTLVWGAYHGGLLEPQHVLPTARNEPLRVVPRYDVPEVVSDEQLSRVLHKLRPAFRGTDIKINHVDHALRFWGLLAMFEDPACLSGEEMRQLLLDHEEFVKVYGPKRPPLLMDTQQGVRVRVQEGRASSSHYDHTLATLAEIGTPLDSPLRSPLRKTNVATLLDQTLRDFSLNQAEYEWSALAFALYLQPLDEWQTTEGQWVSFDRLADRLMRQELPLGVCAGNHRLHALVTFLRIDEETPLLSPEKRAEVIDFLKGVTALLVRNQHPEGYWTRDWPSLGAPSSDSAQADGSTLQGRILATGHPLEWWALAPEEVLPPRHVLVSAGQWLVRAIDDLSDRQVQDYYTFLSHAGHALSIWRGREPYEVELAP
jgi:hypothetical protein